MTARTTKKEVERRVNYNALVGTLTIVVGKEESSYWVDRLDSDYHQAGERAYRLTPFLTCRRPDQPEHYDIVLGDASECECRGFLRWHHCKHVDALVALRAAGKLS